MCLILFKYQPNEHYKLLLLANRDEYHQRQAKQADYWINHPHIFGGIDSVAGGSWLSVDTAGRLAAITNIRKPPFAKDNKLSRGHIINDFLSQQQPAPEFLDALKLNDTSYGLFNLLLFDKTGLWHYSSDTHISKQVEPGIHGLSNASLDTPWPKITTGSEQLKHVLDGDSIDPVELINIMQSEKKPIDAQLPHTGVGVEFERFLSTIFIRGENYGTRCTTLLTIDNEDFLQFVELSYDKDGHITSEVMQEIELSR
ncbi:MAG: NRDE family protein [Cycloclasticus sp.]